MKFSIITVVLNDNKNIEKTILSVQEQSYKSKEHIIIDGKSSDGTWETIKKYSKIVRHFRKKDKSLYDAINSGIKKSKGDIIFVIHSGDILSDKNILKKINLIFKKNFDVVSGNVAFYDINEKSITRNWVIKTKKLNESNFYKIPHTSLFLKKTILNKLGKYSLKYKISSDLDFLIRLGKIKKKFFYFDQYIIFMKTGGLSTSKNNLFLKVKEDLSILLKYFGIFFLIIYIKKILIKLPSFFYLNKKKINIKLKDQLKILNEK